MPTHVLSIIIRRAIKASIAATILIGAVTTSSVLVADVLNMQTNSRQENSDRPPRGLTKAQVEHRYGAPISRHGPTGEPAIYFWEYDGFTVYFENDYVLHAVSKKKSNKPMKNS